MFRSHTTSLYRGNFVVLSFLLFFWGNDPVTFAVKAQEPPSLITAFYDPMFMYRQNVCGRHKAYQSGEVEFRDALQDLELRVMLGQSSLFPLREDNTIDPQYPGLLGVLMDELAIRAGFTWRNSYAVYTGDDIGENKTWTDALVWGVDAYDVMVDWWNKSIERLRLGIGYPEGFYDASFILIGTDGKESSMKVELFNFLRPFSMTLWWAILGTTIVSILIYMVIEGSPNNEAWNVGWNLYLGILMFTQHFSYEPVSAPGRLFGASMAFWSLLIIVAYTANLASFFVAQNVQAIQINTMDDAIKENFRICLWDKATSGTYARARYPQGRFVGYDTEPEVLMGVKSGACELALLNLKSWEQFEVSREYNGDCDLIWIGRVVKFVEAGFGLKNDAGLLCTSLIHDVLNLHLVEMHSDGFIENAWKEHFSKTQDLDCNVENEEEEVDLDSLQLTLSQMAGTFIVHACAGAFAVLIAVGAFVRKKMVARNSAKNISDGGDFDTGKAEKTSTRDPPYSLVSSETEKEYDEDTSSLSNLQGQLHDFKEDTNSNLKNLSAAHEAQKEEMTKMMALLKAVYRNQANQERSQSQSLFQLSQLRLSQSEHLSLSQSELEKLD